jgi:hypothetical protein
MDYVDLDADSPYFSDATDLRFQIPSVIIIHGVVAVITIFFHTFVYFPIHRYYSNIVWTNQFFAVRWIEYGLTCTLMTIASVLSSGTVDFNLIVLVIFSGIALQFMGCCIEQFKIINIYRSFFVVGVLIQFGTSWTILWGYFSGTSDASVWLEAMIYLFYYSLFAVNNITDVLFRKQCFVQTDWYYNVLSLTSKVALFWIQVGGVERTVNGGIWPEIQIYALGTAIPFVFLFVGYILRPVCIKIVHNNRNAREFYGWLANVQFGVKREAQKKAAPHTRPQTRDDIRHPARRANRHT